MECYQLFKDNGGSSPDALQLYVIISTEKNNDGMEQEKAVYFSKKPIDNINDLNKQVELDKIINKEIKSKKDEQHTVINCKEDPKLKKYITAFVALFETNSYTVTEVEEQIVTKEGFEQLGYDTSITKTKKNNDINYGMTYAFNAMLKKFNIGCETPQILVPNNSGGRYVRIKKLYPRRVDFNGIEMSPNGTTVLPIENIPQDLPRVDRQIHGGIQESSLIPSEPKHALEPTSESLTAPLPTINRPDNTKIIDDVPATSAVDVSGGMGPDIASRGDHNSGEVEPAPAENSGAGIPAKEIDSFQSKVNDGIGQNGSDDISEIRPGRCENENKLNVLIKKLGGTKGCIVLGCVLVLVVVGILYMVKNNRKNAHSNGIVISQGVSPPPVQNGQTKSLEDLLKDYYIAGSLDSAVQAHADVQIKLADQAYQRQDYEEAAEQYFQLAKQGDVYAQYMLGVLLEDGSLGFQDSETASVWYGLAADQGYADAQYRLGGLYYQGDGVDRDRKKAAELYEAAARQDHVEAMYALANQYYNGEGTDQNFETAMYWYKAAAELGNTAAMYAVGCLYYNGTVPEEGSDTALIWFRKAAELGHSNAQYMTGYIYFYGIGDVDPSSIDAEYWIGLAAVQGHQNSQNMLGYICELQERYAEAAHWYLLANPRDDLSEEELIDILAEGNGYHASPFDSNDKESVGDAAIAETERRYYTTAEVDDGVLGDTVIFNSITDGNKGSEEFFVRIQKADPEMGNPEQTSFDSKDWYRTSIDVQDGETYTIRLYVHNDNPGGEEAAAEGVKASFIIPEKEIVSKSLTVYGCLECSNSVPTHYQDTVTLRCDNDFYIEFVSGSARFINAGMGTIPLSNSVVEDGVLLGYDRFDGRIPGGFEYDGVVLIDVKIHVADAAKLTIEYRIKGSGKFLSPPVYVNIGDEIDCRIHFKNMAAYTVEHIVIRNELPPNVQCVEGSMYSFNSNHKDGIRIDEKMVMTDGYDIGAYSTKGDEYIQYTIRIEDEDLNDGSNELENRAYVTVGNKVYEARASIVVYRQSNRERESFETDPNIN